MKTSKLFFDRKSGFSSISAFEEFAMNKNLMNNVRGGDGLGAPIYQEDDPHPTTPPPTTEDPSTTQNP